MPLQSRRSSISMVPVQKATRKVLGNLENKNLRKDTSFPKQDKLVNRHQCSKGVPGRDVKPSIPTTGKTAASTLPVNPSDLLEISDVQTVPTMVPPARVLPPDVVDIDAKSRDNLFMYSDYAEDVYSYLRNKERFLRPDFLKRQRQITPLIRTTFIDWLVKVHYQLRLLPETLYLTVNLVDRFLQITDVPTKTFQVLGVAALFVASKYEERYPLSVEDLVTVSAKSCNKSSILAMEIRLLKSLRFNISRPLPVHFLSRYAQAAACGHDTYCLAKYIMETSLLDHEMVTCSPSLLAASSLCLAKLVIELEPDWTPELKFYSTYDLDKVMPVVEKLTHCLRKFQTSCIRDKYSKPCYVGISKLPQLEAYLKDF